MILLMAGCREQEPQPPQRDRQPIIPGLAELVARTPAIVVGQVVRISNGRVGGPAEEPLQFQNVFVAIEQYMKGGPHPDTLVLEQPASEGRVLLDFQSYSPGERFILFVRPGQGGHHVTLTQGRYRIDGEVVRALHSGTIADKIEGLGFEKLRRQIESIVRRSP